MRRNTRDEFLNFPQITNHVFIQTILMSVIRHKKLNLQLSFETQSSLCLFDCFCFCLFTKLLEFNYSSYQNLEVSACFICAIV